MRQKEKENREAELVDYGPERETSCGLLGIDNCELKNIYVRWCEEML